MATPAKEPDLKTMTAVGKVSVTDDRTALLLGLLDFSAIKLWSTAIWYLKEIRETTGKIPSYAKMDVAIKQEHSLWYRRLRSQSAQAILGDNGNPWHIFIGWCRIKYGNTQPKGT